MDKKERLKYLSQWSGLQKDILGNLNYGYQNELEKIAQEARDQYKKDFEALQKTVLGYDIKSVAEQYSDLTKTLGLQSSLDEIKKMQSVLNSSLNDTIKNLTASYSDKTAVQTLIEDMNKVNLTRFDIVSGIGGDTDIPTTSESVDVEDETPEEKPIKITQIKLHNFRFFHKENTFKCENGESVLLYGENGSGKSSLYKAFELLIKGKIEVAEFESHVNIHNQDEPYVEFEFDKEEDSLKIDEDHLELEDTHLFVKNLSVFKPMLDYKDLLRIYFTTSENDDSHNLFPLFEELLREYPIEGGKILKDLTGDAYFEKLKEIILDLKESMNNILNRFDFGVVVEDIACDAFQKKINIKIEGIQKHNDFLNEAKLSALALSIFFSVILKIYTFLPDKSLKILVLDDLLLSLNMSNRHKVLNLLLDEELFDNFQFFIFTHDRAFFERSKQIFDYRQRGLWKYFEMYIDSDDEKGIELPHIKKSNSNLERAQEHFKNKDYPASANYLRKEVENLLDKFLKLDDLDEKIRLAKFKENVVWIRKLGKNIKKTLSALESFENCEKATSPDDVALCVKFSKDIKTSIESLLEYIDNDFHFEEFEDVKLILKSILHPQSHDDGTKPLYKKELEDAIELMEEFKRILDTREE